MLLLSSLSSRLKGLPLELYTLWHQYPWQLGSAMCRLKTFILEGTANASVLTLGMKNGTNFFLILFLLEI